MDTKCECGFCKPRGAFSRRTKLTLLLLAILSVIASGSIALSLAMK